jgi:lipopolysaccharide export system protein LptA
MPGQLIDLSLGEKLSAASAGIYIDRLERIIKLTGDVALRSQRGQGAEARYSSIRSAHYAEIHIAGTEQTAAAPADPLGDFDRLESASFVGDVQVDLGGQKLTAQQLQVRFRPDAEEQTLEQSLDTAIADGGVCLTGGGGTLTSVQLTLAFATTEAGKLYPRRMHAIGAVDLVRQDGATPNPLAWYWTRLRTLPGRAPQPSRIRGDEVVAQLAPPPDASEKNMPELLIRSLEVTGRAEIIDPANRVLARGSRVKAVFEGANELVTADVTGTADEPGLVYAEPFGVRGGRIDLDRAAQTLHVDGPSRMSFKTRRSLQGQQRRDPTRIVVTSSRQLHVDGRGNEVKFVGDVEATSAGEQLKSDVLTLYLEDVPEVAAPSRRLSWAAILGPLTGSQSTPPSKRTYGVGIGMPGDRIRKEPTWLTAQNALVRSESYVAGDDDPILHASISTPSLRADLINRQIVAQPAQLLMIDRRAGDGVARSSVTGVPSALMGGGPSQTAVECRGRMTYTLGPDGPERQDTVVFEDAVYFRHVSGEVLLSPSDAEPVSPTDPALADTLVGRDASLECERLECWFSVDAEGEGPQSGGGLTRSPMRLASFIASDSVYLRYEEGPQVRDVVADWVSFDRQSQLIQVRGGALALARVYSANQLSGESDVQTVQEAIIDLKDGTLRARDLTGRMRRP